MITIKIWILYTPYYYCIIIIYYHILIYTVRIRLLVEYEYFYTPYYCTIIIYYYLLIFTSIYYYKIINSI